MEFLPNFISEAIKNEPHCKTKYHHETLLEHLLECADNCKRLSSQFNVPEDLGYLIGLFHDIGKPFTRVQFKKKMRFMYQGHAQVGSYLISRIPNISKEYKEILMWITDNHMCCCSHQKDLNILTQFKGLFGLIIPEKNKELCIRALALLYVGDSISRITDESEKVNEDLCIKHSMEFIDKMKDINNNKENIRKICIQKKCINDKIVIHSLGTTGCGKSTFSKNLVSQLNGGYIIERDNCYYEIAKNNGLIGENYQNTYNFVSELEDGKEQVQKLFVKQLSDALEDSDKKIIVIDTMQTLFGPAWKRTIDSLTEDAKNNYSSSLKIGVYLFPQNYFSEFTPKTGIFSYYPPEKAIFPKTNLETGLWDPLELDFGTGNTAIINMICNRYLDELILPEVPEQKGLIQLGLSPGQICAQFPPGIVYETKEFESKKYCIITLTYKDGFQIFTGPTRDYRGESMILDKETNEWHLIRGSLPVFPDFVSIEKDPAVYPYLQDVWNFQTMDFDNKLPILRQEWLKLIQFTQNFKIRVTPKYDGSLFNLTFIPHKMFDIPCEYKCKYGKLYFGSKGRFIAKEPVKTRIMNAIEGIYHTVYDFIDCVEKFLEMKNLTQEKVCLHFEAIDAIPTPELTVFYGRAWCPFFGYTVFNDYEKHFNLPKKDDLLCVTEIQDFNNWNDLIYYFKDNYQKLINGNNVIEPEGYVLHIIDNDTNKWLPVKLKYEFYYIAHKPDSKNNKEKAKMINDDDTYKLLRNRLAKFRDRPTIERMISSDINEFIQAISISPSVNRKEWAIYWNSKKNDLDVFGEKIESIVIQQHEYMKDKIKYKIFNVLMKLYGKEINHNTFIDTLIQ
jgi:hypothetical protein